MSKSKIIIILCIILLIIIIGYFSSRDEYTCPELDKLFYKKSIDTYILGKNCQPHPGLNGPCDVDRDYEQWVNDNCGIKFEINVAE